jgi:hypothetical protein
VQKAQAKSGYNALLEDTFERICQELTVTGSAGSQITTLDSEFYTESEKGMFIFINGQLQDFGVDYTVSGTTITWVGYNTDSIDISGEKIIAIVLKARS